MPASLYKEHFDAFFASDKLRQQMDETIKLLLDKKRIFFIGNGGSNSICSHMMEDYAKIAGFKTFSFSDAALITCFANDYGYERAIEEWLKIYFEPGDVLIAISSSGNSMNIVNAATFAREVGEVITLSGFKPDNKLAALGSININLPVLNYGIVECFHQVILHIILDAIHEWKNGGKSE